jgi:hypothetical protein
VLAFQNWLYSVSSGERTELALFPQSLVSLNSVAYCALFNAGGPPGRNWLGELITHGVIVANWSPENGRFPGGVDRHAPIAATPKYGAITVEKPSVFRQAQIAAAT